MHYTNFISRLFEKFASYAFSPKIQRLINGAYIKIFNISLEEFDTLESYPTLNALFTRSLVKMRAFDKNIECCIAPCDSLIMEYGACVDNLAMQIKGKTYRVQDFIGGHLEEGYSYVNFYLSPSDYHRFHAPMDLKVQKLEFFNGKLLSVNKKSLQKNENLFVQNKRVVLQCVDVFGNLLYFVAVGALNVGRIQINFAPDVAQLKDSKTIYFETPITLKKGDEIGSFLMGSTIVLLSKNWEYDLKIDAKVRFGQSIGKTSLR